LGKNIALHFTFLKVSDIGKKDAVFFSVEKMSPNDNNIRLQTIVICRELLS
jgi:hypothetical protein